MNRRINEFVNSDMVTDRNQKCRINEGVGLLSVGLSRVDCRPTVYAYNCIKIELQASIKN